MSAAALKLDAWLDQALGGPEQAAAHLAGLDREETFPAEILDLLDDFGLPDYYVPARWGGRLTDHEELLYLWRVLARRDLTVAVAHCKTYLGAICVWIAGDDRQAQELADAVRAGSRAGWALSEPEHGADLLAGELTAARTGRGGWRLDGVKWPVNNATRGDRLTVLARTDETGGPRGHSLFLVDKESLPPGSCRALPKALTHGIRGADISGVAFEAAPVPDSAVIGRTGSGVETVLRGLQLTRTLCAALSLGCGEHALRITANFAAERVIRDRPLVERPFVRGVLARCGALLAATEAAALLGARSTHSLTGELSVVSAVVKALAPTLVDDLIGELAELLGARSFLAGVYEEGAFQKIWRDHQVVAVFDGSTPVNRAALAVQFPPLVAGFETGAVDLDGLAEAVRVGSPPRPLDESALTLTSRLGCSAVQRLPALAAELADGDAPATLVAAARHLVRSGRLLHTRMAAIRPSARPPAEAHELAAGYELLYAGAAVLHLWRADATRRRHEPLWQDALWARAALRELLLRLDRLLAVPLENPTENPTENPMENPMENPDEEAKDIEESDATDEADTLIELMAAHLMAAATTGAPLTPFGTPFGTPLGEHL